MSENIRKDLARLVWIGGGGTPDGWDRNHGRPQPSHGPARPNYIDEKVAEAWATANLILAYLSSPPTPPVAPNLAQGGRNAVKKPPHLCPLCPMCGAYSPRSCDLEDECGGVCPWVESGQHERDCGADDEDDA